VKLQIREIPYSDEEYRKELALRDEVLRKPLGRSLYDENLDAERDDYHIGAFINGQLIGVLILRRLNSTDIKMKQVAVTERWQGHGTGREMVRYAEEYAKNNGYTDILLNARKTATGFYEKQGYDKIGEEFLEIDIPHFKMRKSIL